MAEDLISVRQKIEIPFQYTAGPAMTGFLEGLKEKTILAGVCSQCGRSSVPPLSFCGRCWQPVATYKPLSGEGTLLSYTRAADGTTYGLVRLDGSDSSLVHRLGPGEFSVIEGARVRPVWSEQRKAGILDIEYFQLVG